MEHRIRIEYDSGVIHRIRCNTSESVVSFGRKSNVQNNGKQYVYVLKRGPYQTFWILRTRFHIKIPAEKLKLDHLIENKCGYQLHIFVIPFSWRCLFSVQPLWRLFCAKCTTTKILQVTHQNPVVPSGSAVHQQNPVCTYKAHMTGVFVGMLSP